MKHILSLIIALLYCFGSVAQVAQNEQLKITRLTGESVKVGKRSLKVGDSFKASDAIVWSSTDQMLEAKSASGNIYRFSKRQFDSKSGAKSVYDFFLRMNKASTRSATDVDFTFTQSPKATQVPEKRLALVIGNANYTDISALRNPIFDASAIADELSNLGFDVIEAYDVAYADMVTVLNNFASRAKDYDAAFFYYSGHGLQENGHNYLIPVNAKLEFRSELDKCLNTFDVIDKIEASGVKSRIICFDACRDVKTTWTRSATQGLTTIEGAPGSVVICSTRSGQVAYDGEGDNSPFAYAILKALETKDRSFPEVTQEIATTTYQLTDNKQWPSVSGALTTSFIFNPIATTAAPRTVAKAVEREVESAIAEPVQEPALPAPSMEFNAVGVDAKVTSVSRQGSNVVVDIVLTNMESKAKNAKILDQEPCYPGFDDYQTQAYDSNGNAYHLKDSSIRILRSNGNSYGDQNLPTGVPVKIKMIIMNVPTSETYLPLASIAFRGLNPYNSYGQAVLKIHNLPIK